MPGTTGCNQGLDVRGKYVRVIGAARSGISAARALQASGARVVLTDNKPVAQLSSDILSEIQAAGITLVAGASVADALPDGTDLVVTSPGVWKTADVLAEAVARRIPVWSEIELAFRLSDSRIIATTGTNGKTTCTLLIASILQHAGLDAVAAGNVSADEIKCTLVDAAYRANLESAHDRILVAEISSFQLEWIERFRPWIALLTNVTPDHMNRHASFDEYFKAKLRLFENQQSDDWALLNYDDQATRDHGLCALKSNRVWISAQGKPAAQSARAWQEDGRLIVELSPGSAVTIMLIDRMPASLMGAHSILNVLAASTAATIAGVSPAVIEQAVSVFPGVPHRMEFVAEISGVRYWNNSMCTNPAAFIASLKAVGSPAVVIAGGADKAIDFLPLAEPMKKYARHAVLIGQAASKMEIAFRTGGFTDITRAASLEEAVLVAAQRAMPGDAVMLSPACASFDMFRDFEARGAAFRAAVRALHSAVIQGETR